MTWTGYERVKACFEAMEEIFPFGDQRLSTTQPSKVGLPQLPQKPQTKAATHTTVRSSEVDREERAAIMEYDGGLPRKLAEFLAGCPRR